MKAAIAITMILTASAAVAESEPVTEKTGAIRCFGPIANEECAEVLVHSMQTQIGTETVTVKIMAGRCKRAEMDLLYDQIKDTTPLHELEQIAERLWHCGSAEALRAMGQFREQRMDLVGAYAHLVALGEYAKLNAKKNSRTGQEAAWDRVQVPFYAGIHKEIAELGKRLTPEQKARALKQAAQIVRDNPNCCQPM